jgi:hypothetical protein
MSFPKVFELFGSAALPFTSSIHCVEHGELGVTCSARDNDGNRQMKIDFGFDRCIMRSLTVVRPAYEAESVTAQ